MLTACSTAGSSSAQGSSKDSSRPEQNAVSSSSSSQASPAAVPAGVTVPSTLYGMQFRQDIMEITKAINDKRQQKDLTPLLVDSSLTWSALNFCVEIQQAGMDYCKKGNFNIRPNGQPVSSLLTEAGYGGSMDQFAYRVVWNASGASMDDFMNRQVSQLTNAAVLADASRFGLVVCSAPVDWGTFYCAVMFLA